MGSRASAVRSVGRTFRTIWSGGEEEEEVGSGGVLGATRAKFQIHKILILHIRVTWRVTWQAWQVYLRNRQGGMIKF